MLGRTKSTTNVPAWNPTWNRNDMVTKSPTQATVPQPPPTPQPEHMLSTQEILTSVGKLTQEDIAHRLKIARVLGRNDYTFGISSEIVERALQSGFIWTVDPEFICKFKYGASVRVPQPKAPMIMGVGFIGSIGTPFTESCCVNRYIDSIRHEVQYMGDFPDFALDRIQKAISAGLGYITIHSNQELEVKLLQKIDPVLIAWDSNPHIYYKDGEVGCSTKLGFVIAAWDFDTEIPVGG